MAAGKSEAHPVYQAIDSLLANRKPQPVVEITDNMLRSDPRDWEALYRAGVALAALEKPDEAIKRFQDLLSLTINDDEKSSAAKARSNPKLQAAGVQARPAAGTDSEVALARRIYSTYAIRAACQLDARSAP